MIIDDHGEATTYQDQGKLFIEVLERAEKFTIMGINQADEKTDFLDPYVQKVFLPYDQEVSWFYNSVYIDIMAFGSSKGNGMQALADLLGIDHKNVYAIGDSYNDLSMIEKAGCGITFTYSDQEIQSQADVVVNYLYEACDTILEK